MKCPNTPKSVISELLNKEHSVSWQSAWKEFYRVYYSTMLAMTRNEFNRIAWHNVTNDEIAEIISDTVLSIMKIFERQQYNKACKFRGLLKKIIASRVIDYVRSQNKKRRISVEAIDVLDAINQSNVDIVNGNTFFDKLEEDESVASKKSVVMDAWANIRASVSPQTALICEMSQFEGKSVKEILSEFDVERRVIDSTVHRVLKKLRQKLNEESYRKELEK